jgi:hypothetical protein
MHAGFPIMEFQGRQMYASYWFVQVPSNQARLWTEFQMDARMKSPTEVRATQDVDLAMNLDPCDLHQRLDLG